jgi:hypothetical protein
MMGEPDCDNRDPNNLNDHVKVAWEDVFGEPEGAHSHECVWKLAYKCFTGGLSICYMILTFICAVPYALCWGCEFACVAFYHVWIMGPTFRLLSINCVAQQKIMTMMLQGCMVPCIETCGLCFSKIKVEKA